MRLRSWMLVPIFSAVSSFGWAASPSPILQLPNRLETWSQTGFANMVGALRLPTDNSKTDIIQVWLKLPESGKLSAQLIHDSRETRYTLVYPPGTVADRVEFDRSSGGEFQGISDVRGARIDEQGNTVFHDYETVPGTDERWLQGYEWKRVDDAADVAAGESLVALFYPGASEQAKNRFRRLNHCGDCHQANAPTPLTTAAPYRFESDARGFFQPITVLLDQISVRDHRSHDLNAEDPFVSVWCGDQPTHAISNPSGSRWYQCPNDLAPVGKLDLPAALRVRDEHALQVCESRAYLFKHMDSAARSAFAQAFLECGIRSSQQPLFQCPR